MQRKWIAVLVFWTVFLVYMLVGLSSRNRWFDGALIAASAFIYLGLGVIVITRCVRRGSFEPFWRGRGYPEWFLRFISDEPASKRRGARPDPML